MIRNLLFFLILSLLFPSCQKREWNNPFDPECPKELWTPTNFAAIQQGNAIKLNWVQAEKNISGFRIERKIEGETSWTVVVSPTKTTNTWTDQSITGGKFYEYLLVALASGNESNYVNLQIKPLLTATLTTNTPSAITATSALLGGTITTDDGASITECGVCWATTTSPTTSNNKLAIGSATGTFSNTITGLTANTTYYVRAYAINSQDTAYGNEVSFKTNVVLSLATLTTDAATNITSNSATLGGNITSDGNATVTERGVCYSTTTNPTTSSTKVAIGNGTGSFSNSITGLTANSTYYVRAYAINSQGTAYGNELNFKTSLALSLATLTTSTPTNITSTSATMGGNVTSDGNTTVTERGVCYSTSTNPTTSNTKFSIGTGIGSFSNSITGLTANTTYYVRAYAINSQGTAYGNEVNFKTSVVLSLATLTTNAATNITSSNATLGGNVTSDGNATVTERGVCYSTNTNPTTSNTKLAIGSGTGTFSNTITGLTANTTYYVRAYATNSQGTAYGNEVSFLTKNYLLLNNPTDVTSNSVTISGIYTKDENNTINELGICYSTSQNPTTSNSKIIIGNVMSSFSTSILGLAPNIYYFRAYTISIGGTKYSNQVSFTSIGLNIISDIEGNTYKTVIIGSQVWMVENLKVTTFRNGDPIQNITENTQWNNQTSSAYCWYNNENYYENIYGALYNWLAVNDSRNIAPPGWHIPTGAEWTTLTNYLGGTTGGKLKESGTLHWLSPNTGATNSSGFTALPGGYRNDNGTFTYINEYAYFWSSSISTVSNYALGRFIGSGGNNIGSVNFPNRSGFSVRCVMD